MFKPLRYDAGRMDTLLTASSTTIVKGDALDFASGYLQRATSTAPAGIAGGTPAGVHCIAMESVTTAAAAHSPIQVLFVDDSAVDIEADCNGTPTQAMVGTVVDLQNASTLNEAATSVKIFFITNLVSATNKKVKGRFARVNS